MTKKDTILFITIFCVLALIAGSTYAYWGWSSNESKSVVFNTSKGIEDYVIYDAGESHFVGDFKASSTFCDGLHNTVTMSKVTDASEMMLIGTLKMDVNSIENNMKSTDALGWAVVSGDGTSCTSDTTALVSGTFKNVNSVTTLTLLEDMFIGTSAASYTVYIWLNTATASDALSGETLDVNIWTQVDQVAAWYGDVNLDGIVNFSDYATVSAYVKGTTTFTAQQKVNADVNLDGAVDSTDVNLILTATKNPSASSMPASPAS